MSSPKRPEKILVVDDQSANLAILKHILSSSGFEPTLVDSGTQALESIALSLPDLVLLDIIMPGMDGFEVCQALKSKPATRRIPILLISGLSETDAKTKGLGIGASDYIIKPFESAEVLARIETHLRIGKLEARLRHSESAMRHAERIARIGTWTKDLATGAVEWSDEMFQLFGEDSKETDSTLPTIIARRVCKEDRAKAESILLSVKDVPATTWTAEFRLVGPEGEERLLRATVPSRLEGMPGDERLLIGIVQDITDIRKFGIREAETVGRHSRILKTLHVGFVLMDAHYVVLETNATFQHTCGFPEAELVGNPIGMLDLPESRDNLESVIGQAFMSGLGLFRSCLRHKDGRSIAVEAVVGSDEQAGSTIYAFFKEVGPSSAPHAESRGE